MMASRFSLLRQLAWAATLATGFGTAWFLAVVLLGTWIHEAWQGGKRSSPERLLVRSDGTLFVESYRLDDLSKQTVRDLEGRTQVAPEMKDQIGPVYLSGETPKPGYFTPQPGWSSRLMSFVNEQEPSVNWFFVHDGKPVGSGYFVAYDRESKRRIGFLGMSGFRADPVPRADWIPLQGEPTSSAPLSIYSGHSWQVRPVSWDVPPHWVYVPYGTLLRKVDLTARTVTTILETQEPIEAVGVPALVRWALGNPTKEQLIYVRTAHQIQVLDQRDHLVRAFSIPAEVDPRSQVAWYELGTGQAIAVFLNRLVYRISGDGAIQDHFTVDLQAGSSIPDQRTQTFALALGIASPTIMLGIGFLVELEADETRDSPAGNPFLMRDFWLSLIAVFVLSCILAFMAWRRSCAFGLSRREQIAWVVFVLLFGLPAYAGFRLNRRWPIRLLCPDCHARVPRDREACAECGRRFPDPTLKGIEIFA